MKTRKTTRRQARSEVSRQAVIDAVIDLIANHGISAATTARIAEHAGVSWGVLQYHFGDKREIFLAALSASNPAMFQEIGDIDIDERDPEALMTEAVDKIWKYNSSPNFRAAEEILLNHAHLGDDFYDFAMDTFKALNGFLRRVFKACGSTLSRAQENELCTFMLASLRGMAMQNATFPTHEMPFSPQRRILVETVLLRLNSN